MLKNSLAILPALFLVFAFAHSSLARRRLCVEEEKVSDELPGYELVLVQTVWRHGDRGLNYTYPTDPNQESVWRYGWEELTPKGMAEMAKLGEIYRKRYILDRSFLSELYTPKEIYVRSTDINRNLASAQSTMAGLYPLERLGLDIPSKKQLYNWPSHWVPVPVHAPVPFWSDRFVPVGINCPRYLQILSEIRNSSKYKQIFEADETKKFLAYVSKKAGVSPPYTDQTIWTLYDSAWREQYDNLPQPDWYTKSVLKRVKYLSTIASQTYKVFAPWALSDELIRLLGGPLLKDIVDRSQLKFDCLDGKQSACEYIVNDVQKIKDLKFYFYTKHGSTLTQIAYTLGLQDRLLGVPNIEPPFSGSFIYEFWARKQKDNNQKHPHMIRILFRNSVYVKEYQTITGLIHGCNGSDFCPFEAFKESHKKYIPIDIEKECELKQ